MEQNSTPEPESIIPCGKPSKSKYLERPSCIHGPMTSQGQKWTCKEKAREYDRAWRAANPEKYRERQRKYYEANHEELLEQQRVWRAANPEKEREQSRARRAANPEKERERLRAWREANSEKVREGQREYYRSEVGERIYLERQSRIRKARIARNEEKLAALEAQLEELLAAIAQEKKEKNNG